MRPVVWTDRAKANLKSFIDWYRQFDSDLASAMAREVYSMSSKLRREIDIGRPSEIDGLREKSILKWNKIILYKFVEEEVHIIAIIDPRMDNPREGIIS